MPDPVTVHLKKISVKRFEMLQCQVTLDDNYFHYRAQLTERDFHDAYDADEDFTLLRADAIFINESQEYVVPVFGSKDRTGAWKWLARFRPHRVGFWTMRVRVLCWHPRADSRGEEAAERVSVKDGKTKYFEHDFGYKASDFANCPAAERHFAEWPTRNAQRREQGQLELLLPLARDRQRIHTPTLLPARHRPRLGHGQPYVGFFP